ncbi:MULTISPECIES: hypothetical protein [Bacillus]|uniref:hypothetical protein n=1 Tax=Bacillus TaxID=1386 RepID=UPI000310984F|nr:MULTISPECIES: hypothetical protein [Bacillus]
MNINGMVRGFISKEYDPEYFLKHIAITIEHQLKEWDPYYEVLIMKMVDYHFIVKNKGEYYTIIISEEEVRNLQKKDLFALDQFIWKELTRQGVILYKGYGNYLENVLSDM